jgi:hypothetical protein
MDPAQPLPQVPQSVPQQPVMPQQVVSQPVVQQQVVQPQQIVQPQQAQHIPVMPQSQPPVVSPQLSDINHESSVINPQPQPFIQPGRDVTSHSNDMHEDVNQMLTKLYGTEVLDHNTRPTNEQTPMELGDVEGAEKPGGDLDIDKIKENVHQFREGWYGRKRDTKSHKFLNLLKRKLRLKSPDGDIVEK